MHIAPHRTYEVAAVDRLSPKVAVSDFAGVLSRASFGLLVCTFEMPALRRSLDRACRPLV
jgi:hypothetical protein